RVLAKKELTSLRWLSEWDAWKKAVLLPAAGQGGSSGGVDGPKRSRKVTIPGNLEKLRAGRLVEIAEHVLEDPNIYDFLDRTQIRALNEIVQRYQKQGSLSLRLY